MFQQLKNIFQDDRVENSIVWQKEGNASLYHPRLLFFAHEDRQGTLQPAMVFYLKALANEGFGIIFITTAEKMSAKEVEPIAPFCAHFICIRNRGFHFGCWKVGLWRFDGILDNYGAIILANDSYYAPALDWTPMFAMFQQQKLDICGVSFNTVKASQHHLDTYFLWINHTARNLKFLRDFFSKVKFLNDRDKVQEAYGVGFTKGAQIERLNFSCWVNNRLLADRYQIINEPYTITQPLLLLRLGFSAFVNKSIFTDPAKKDVAQELIQELKSIKSALVPYLTNPQG